MKSIFKVVALAAISCLLVVSSAQRSYGCDRTEYVFDSLTFDGTNFTIYTTLCLGGGIVGSTLGADNWTGSMAFGVYGPASMTMLGFTPAVLVSDTTGCTMTGQPFFGGFGANFGSFYPSPGCFYTCVHDIGDCGRPHTDCTQLSFTVTEVPDSIRAFGTEATGNPIGGCHPEPDLLIDFSTLPVVWTHQEARQIEETVELDWGTSQEVNNSHFQVMRQIPGGEWEEIGRVDAGQNKEAFQSYQFQDLTPQKGTNRYRITQVDLDGRTSSTEVMAVNFSIAPQFAWRSVGPNPSSDFLNLTFITDVPEILRLQLFDTGGSLVVDQDVEGQYGLNRHQLNLGSLPEGIYFLRLKGSQGSLDKKIVKI